MRRCERAGIHLCRVQVGLNGDVGQLLVLREMLASHTCGLGELCVSPVLMLHAVPALPTASSPVLM